jgi:hypothetical protein
MAINQNHLFEDLEGVKCAIVEKNASKERVDFLKKLLEINSYTVVVVPSPPPKTASPDTPPVETNTFTIGVTDVSFNSTNAIFGRLLRTENGHIVTRGYWNQEEKISNDEKPYFQK